MINNRENNMTGLEITPKLTARLMQETKADIIDIMVQALDTMQAYNGRTVTYCIVEALGGTSTELEHGGTSHQYPKYKRKE